MASAGERGVILFLCFSPHHTGCASAQGCAAPAGRRGFGHLSVTAEQLPGRGQRGARAVALWADGRNLPDIFHIVEDNPMMSAVQCRSPAHARRGLSVFSWPTCRVAVSVRSTELAESRSPCGQGLRCPETRRGTFPVASLATAFPGCSRHL